MHNASIQNRQTHGAQTSNPQLKPKLLAITMGDAAGIGPEVIVKAFMEEPELLEHCFVVGEVATLRRAAQVVHAAMRSETPALYTLPWPVMQMELQDFPEASENEFPPPMHPGFGVACF